MEDVHRLEYHAPRRCAAPTEKGKFASRPFSIRDVIATLSGGGWFCQGQHDFADTDAKELAMKYS